MVDYPVEILAECPDFRDLCYKANVEQRNPDGGFSVSNRSRAPVLLPFHSVAGLPWSLENALHDGRISFFLTQPPVETGCPSIVQLSNRIGLRYRRPSNFVRRASTNINFQIVSRHRTRRYARKPISTSRENT